MRAAWLVLALLAQVAGQSAVRPGVIAGRVLAFDGVPTAGIRVMVLDPPTQGAPSVIRSSTETDSSGHYRLDEVPSGRYFLAAGPLDASTYFPGVVAIEQAVTITVVSGSAQENRDFKLAIPLMRLSGRVIREGDKPERQSDRKDQVALSGPGNPQGMIPVPQVLAPIGPDDTFEFKNLRPGLYQLRVVGDGIVMQGVSVSLTNEHVTGYVLNLPQSAIRAAVTVSATVEAGGALPMLSFALTPAAPRPNPLPRQSFSIGSKAIPFKTANDGDTIGPLSVPAGEYTAGVGIPYGRLPEGYSVVSVTAGSLDLLSNNLVLASGDKVKISVVLRVSSPPPGKKIAGRVKAGAGGGAARIGIAGPLTFIAPVAADGTFEFPHVIPNSNRYLVQIFPNVDSADGARLVGYLLMKDAELTNVEIPAALSGFKVSGRGLGLAELRQKGLGNIQLTAVLSEPAVPDGGGPAGFHAGQLSPDRQPVADDGSFQFVNVPPGKYLITFSTEFGGSDIGPLPKPFRLTVVDKDVEGLQVEIPPALFR